MLTPSEEYRTTQLVIPRELPRGADAVVDRILGTWRRRLGVLQDLHKQAQTVSNLAADLRHVGDKHLREKLHDLREALRRNPRQADHLVLPALAAIREAAGRQTGMVPYEVQIIGALALYHGYLAEMATGEGKTLVAGLAAVLGGWSTRPCHIITVNDYLARRDAEWLAPLYRFCGLTVGFVTGEMESAERRQGYSCDITYTTGKELLADFLRDRLRLGPLQHASRRHILHCVRPPSRNQPGSPVMRGLHTAIVDEADSILIDEAVTPLIISQPQSNRSLEEAARVAQGVADILEPGTDYRLDLRYRDIELSESGRWKILAHSRRLGPLWQAPRRWEELVTQALHARDYFHDGQQYVIEDGKIVIVDEFTGRMMHQRTWRHGLHQAIEAKENLPISAPSETLSRLSFQRFFRLFARLSGMTGTAREAAGEFWHVYRLPVVTIPTNRPCIRTTPADRVFATREEKWAAVVAEIVRQNERGRPILVGTRSVAASQLLAERLQALGLEFNLLNAIQHREEASIVAEAGLAGKITIATNMAGRGTDIRLGQGVRELGGLYVLATERHESGRIDRQLFGRCARQGDPGTARAFISLEDDLFVRFLPGKQLRRWLQILRRINYPGNRTAATGAVKLAQSVAQRQAAKQRRSVMSMDDWIDTSLSFAKGNGRVAH